MDASAPSAKSKMSTDTAKAQPSRVERIKQLPGLDLKRLLKTAAIGLTILMIVLASVSYVLHEPVTAFGQRFVESFGGLGVAIGFYIPDAFTVPLPNDAFTLFGVLGGMGFWTVVLWGTAGSVTGALTGFLLGRLLRNTRRLKRLLSRRGAEIHGLVSRYGVTALVVAALTPLPFSIACWSCGALGMKLSVFAAASLLRVVRVAGYLWLIQAGFLTLGG